MLFPVTLPPSCRDRSDRPAQARTTGTCTRTQGTGRPCSNSFKAIGRNPKPSQRTPRDLAMQPIASWASPTSGGPSADASGMMWNGAGQWADARQMNQWYPTQPGLVAAATSAAATAAYYETQNQEETDDSSATSSDSGAEQLPDPAVSGMTPVEATHHVYMQMRNAKRTWRRHTGRPVRKFRRFYKAKQGKGRRPAGHSFMWAQEDLASFLIGKGKGNMNAAERVLVGKRIRETKMDKL